MCPDPAGRSGREEPLAECVADFLQKPLSQLVEEAERRYEILGQVLTRLRSQAEEKAGSGGALSAALAEPLQRFEIRLATHRRREAELFFPLVRKMDEASCNPCGQAPCRFCTVGQPAGLMEHEHEALRDLLGEARVCCMKGGLPGEELHREFEALARDFLALFQLEDEVLIVRALQLERKLKGLPEIG